MYVLARHVGQSIVIGTKLMEIKVLSITGGIVRIGIDAPKEIRVTRKELLEEKEPEDGD